MQKQGMKAPTNLLHVCTVEGRNLHNLRSFLCRPLLYHISVVYRLALKFHGSKFLRILQSIGHVFAPTWTVQYSNIRTQWLDGSVCVHQE